VTSDIRLVARLERAIFILPDGIAHTAVGPGKYSYRCGLANPEGVWAAIAGNNRVAALVCNELSGSDSRTSTLTSIIVGYRVITHVIRVNEYEKAASAKPRINWAFKRISLCGDCNYHDCLLVVIVRFLCKK
jgi:hypothetical protein